MKPSVTVLIDTYNHERFIEEALVRVLEQDFPAGEREILVVDDGSTDRTPEILRKFHPQVRVLRKDNGGQASAFNAGIPEAQGEIVAFLDGDDWWLPNKLSRVMEAMTADPTVGIVGHGIVISGEDGSGHVQTLGEGFRFRAADTEGARLFRLRKSFLGTSRMTIRAQVLRQIGAVPAEIVLQADEYLFTLAAVLSNVQILSDVLTTYRIHDSNGFQMRTFDAGRVRRKQVALDALARALAVRMLELGSTVAVQREITEIIEAEAAQLRLALGDGWSWETVRAEWKMYQALNPESTVSHRTMKAASLLPALLIPPRQFYKVRQAISANALYLWARRRLLRGANPLSHVVRSSRASQHP